MTIAEILALSDDAVIDRIEARAKFFAQDTAGGELAYTAQNGTIRDSTGEIRIRVTNAPALPDNVALELSIAAGVNNRDGSPCGLIRRTFRDTPQVYTTGKAVIEARIADEAADGPTPATLTIVPAAAAAAPPAEPDGRPLPEPDTEPDPALDIDLGPASASATDAHAAPADTIPATPAAQHPLEMHYLGAVEMAERIAANKPAAADISALAVSIAETAQALKIVLKPAQK